MTTDTKTDQTQAVRPQNLVEQISTAEHDLVLQHFAELKRRGDGELRIACRRDRLSGLVEITYVGVHEKADLDGLRKMYAQLRVKESPSKSSAQGSIARPGAEQAN